MDSDRPYGRNILVEPPGTWLEGMAKASIYILGFHPMEASYCLDANHYLLRKPNMPSADSPRLRRTTSVQGESYTGKLE